jgi:hypothetical protein
MKRGLVVAGLGLVLSTAVAGSVSAQSVGADLALNSAYFWRGLSLTNKPVAQPDLYLTFGKSLTFTAGGWANIELGQYNGAEDISEGGGTSAFNLTEFDWWGEFNYPVSILTLTAGATGYIYPNDAGFTKESNTTEIYGKIAFGVPLSPKLAVWYDVDKIKGAYIEASAGLPIHLSPALPLSLGVLAGFSAGQGCEPDASGACNPDVSANFHDDGLTHVDLSASLPISAGPISITPNLHGIIGNDEWVKITKLDPNSASGVQTSDFKVVFGVTLSWSKSFGASEKTE